MKEKVPKQQKKKKTRKRQETNVKEKLEEIHTSIKWGDSFRKEPLKKGQQSAMW